MSGLWNVKFPSYIALCRHCYRRLTATQVRRNECPTCHRPLVSPELVAKIHETQAEAST